MMKKLNTVLGMASMAYAASAYKIYNSLLPFEKSDMHSEKYIRQKSTLTKKQTKSRTKAKQAKKSRKINRR